MRPDRTTPTSRLLASRKSFNFASEPGDNFGAEIAVGRLGGGPTSPDSVVVGAPGQDVVFNGVNRDQAGMALVFVARSPTAVTEKSSGVPGNPENGDRFGQTLAVGDFRADGSNDIVFGVPGEKLGGKDNAGAVIVLTSGASLNYKLISQDTTGVRGALGTGDRFAAALFVADFNGDGKVDLAVGVPLDDESGGVKNAGTVNVLYAKADGTGLPRADDILWTEASVNGVGSADVNDHYGESLR